MPLFPLALILSAALLHAGYHLVVKRAERRHPFAFCALAAGSALFLPVPFLSHSPFPSRVLLFAVPSAILEAVYFLLLTRAYGRADFALVYPVARGAAPVFLQVWAALFLGEPPRPFALGGLSLIVLGVVLVSAPRLAEWRRLGRNLPIRDWLTILGAALCISIYSTLDGAAVRIAAPLDYTIVVLALSALFMAPIVLHLDGSSAIVQECKERPFSILGVGIAMIVAYLLVLTANTLTRVSYVGALREVSVVFAALLGWGGLGEGMGGRRTLGAALIFAGILGIAILG